MTLWHQSEVTTRQFGTKKTDDDVSGHFGTSFVVPNCPGAKVSWCRSVLLPSAPGQIGTTKLVPKCLCFLPAEIITNEFETVEEAAKDCDDRVQDHLQYVRWNWIDGSWRPAIWSVFGQPVRTSNNFEGWHRRLNAKVNHRRLNFYQLLQLLHDEARLVTLAVRMLSQCGTSRMQQNSTATSSSCD